MQKIISGNGSISQISDILNNLNSKKYLLVCDSAFSFLSIKDFFDKIDIPHIKFSDFTANPLYEDVCKGVDLFRKENCDTIVAVGGGSAIDVAKCIKLFSKMNSTMNYLEQPFETNNVPIIALPTTAGTGSESTRFAVIYYNGEKQSIAHESIIPDFAILEPSVLKTLPIYQKKCTMLDALCQGIESYWSVNSTEESKEYSKKAIALIMSNKKDFLENKEIANEKILIAANYAGRAINISQTTAAHAMSYKITSMYGLPHGHAVAICLPKLFNFMKKNTHKCIDSRGEAYIKSVFNEIALLMMQKTVEDAIISFQTMLNELELFPPKINREEDIHILSESVNTTRLRNNPIELNKEELYKLYKEILS